MSDKPAVTFGADVSKTDPQQDANQFLTRQEAVALEARILAEAGKRTQSLTDKLESRVDKRVALGLQKVQDTIAINQRAGIEVSATQIEAMKQQALLDAYAEPTPDQSTPPAKDVTQDMQTLMSQAEIRAVDEITQGFEEEKGIKLAEGDPEIAKYLKPGMTKAQYTRAYDKALDEKLTRTTQNPAGGFPTPGGSVSSTSVLQSEYLTALSKLRKGDANAIIETKRLYRSKGLPI